VSCNLFLLCYIYNLGLYINVWKSMFCLLSVLLLTRLANWSNQFPTPFRPVWCVQEVKSVRPVVRNSQTNFVMLPIFFILLCVNFCHMHHVYLYDTFTLVSTPRIEGYRRSSMILIEYV
jgi:hypothetical protein